MALFALPLKTASASPTFIFTLLAEPTTIDPQMLSSASGNYVATTVYRGLYKWDMKHGLQPDEGLCHWEHDFKKLNCSVNPDAKWSDGSSVRAEDYRRALLFLMNPENGAPLADTLNSVLEVVVTGPKGFFISFKRPDSEFLYKFTHPALFPRHKSFQKKFTLSKKAPVSNGAFKISNWKKEAWIEFQRNSHFPTEGEDLVQKLKALVVESDVTALQLYESKKIQMLRRLHSQEFERFKSNPELHKVKMLRFDYIGFSPALKPYRELRKALATSFDSKIFQKLFDSDGAPGCPSISSKMYTGNTCISPNLKAKSVSWPSSIPPDFGFSRMGGEDIQRGAEWFQGQWKQKLKIQLDLQPRDQKVYLNLLSANPPPLFRKGVGLDRPTCLGALEIFSKSHPENYIHFDSEEYEKTLKKMESTLDEDLKKDLCTKALKLLISDYWIIPLGEMSFTILVNSRFTGWTLNELNQLDLRDLRYSAKP